MITFFNLLLKKLNLQATKVMYTRTDSEFNIKPGSFIGLYPAPLLLFFVVIDKANPLAKQQPCTCKNRCATKRCPCKLKGVTCTIFCHPAKTCSNRSPVNEAKEVIDLTDDTAPLCADDEDVWKAIGKTKLHIQDRKIIENGYWLSDKIIFAAEQLLQDNILTCLVFKTLHYSKLVHLTSKEARSLSRFCLKGKITG